VQGDVESRSYWEPLHERRIVLQRCTACARLRFPPMPACPYCGTLGRGEESESTGLGAVYSYVRVHRALTPAMEGEVPYTVAVVQLDDGPRLLGRVEESGVLRIGDRVQPCFTEHGEWTELRFAPAAPDGSAA
jgi:uncharacterized protein